MSVQSRVLFAIISAILLMLFFNIKDQIFINIEYDNGYTLGDWLINYQDGGFKRRGLSGSFFFFLHDIFGVPIKKSVYYFQLMLYLVFFISFLRLSYKARPNWAFLGLVFSTCTLLYMIYEPGSIGRKEIMLFAFYSVFLNILINYSNKLNLILIYFSVTSIIGILYHEIYFFYLPLFILPFLYRSKMSLAKKDLIKIISIMFGVALILIVALKLFGGEINQGNTFNELVSRGVNDKMSTYGNRGILTWDDNFNKIAYFKNNQYYLYLISFVIGNLIFYLYAYIHGLLTKKFDYILISLCIFAFSFPAYVLAIDWGRWINIHFIMMLIYFTYLQATTKNKMEAKRTYLIVYFVILIASTLIWRFDLVDKGFYLDLFIK